MLYETRIVFEKHFVNSQVNGNEVSGNVKNKLNGNEVAGTGIEMFLKRHH